MLTFVYYCNKQTGHTLTYCELSTRHNFSLLLLQRAWQAPWTPETHASFQPRFRAAVGAVAKATHHLGFPLETMTSICSFFGRDWWEDSRKQCWNYACLFEKDTEAITRKMSPEANTIPTEPIAPVTPNLDYCSQCHVALYCSKNCRNRDHYLGHKGKCNRPPLVATRPDAVETQLYLDTLTESGNSASLPNFLASLTYTNQITKQGTDIRKVHSDDDESNVSDDGSWETVDSDEESIDETANQTKTQKIWKYFHDQFS